MGADPDSREFMWGENKEEIHSLLIKDCKCEGKNQIFYSVLNLAVQRRRHSRNVNSVQVGTNQEFILASSVPVNGTAEVQPVNMTDG